MVSVKPLKQKYCFIKEKKKTFLKGLGKPPVVLNQHILLVASS